MRRDLPNGHRIALALIVLMFLAFAGLQFNDPDPEIWVSIYAIAALLPAVALFQHFPWWTAAVLAVGNVLGAILLWPEHYQGMTGSMDDNPSIELARESMGLAICACTCVYVGVVQRMYRELS